MLVTDVADKGNTVTFFRFLFKAVRAFAGKKLYMVLDNVRFHHAKRLKPILERYKHKIELIFLPPYVADLFGVNKNTVSNWCKSYKTEGNNIEAISGKN